MSSIQSCLRINNYLSSKNEIVFDKKNGGNRIVLKLKSSYNKDLSDKFQILTQSAEAWNHILPFSYDKDFIDQFNKQFSLATYEQIKMQSLRDEIQLKLQKNQQFSMEEILGIYYKINKTLDFLYALQIYPSFITIDNICYDPTKPTKEWVLNIQNFFKYTESHENQYFTYQLCEEFYDKLKKKNKLSSLPNLAMQKENCMNLGICLLQACLLQQESKEYCNQFHNNNHQIRTLNYYHLYTKTLKIIYNRYSPKLANLIKFMVFTPYKCFTKKEDKFWEYINLIEEIAKIQELINAKQPETALANIDQFFEKWNETIDQGDIFKIKALKSQCLYLSNKYEEFWSFNDEITSEMKKKFHQENIQELESLVIYLKLLYKQFILTKELNDFSKQEAVLNKILNEAYWFQKLIIKQFKNQKAFCIKHLQAILQFLNQLFPQLSCNQATIKYSVEYYANFMQASSDLCLIILSLMKSNEQFQSSIKKQFFTLKEIQNDLDFIAQVNYHRIEDLSQTKEIQKLQINTSYRGKNNHNKKIDKASRKAHKELNFVFQLNNEQADLQSPVRKQIC